MAHAQFSLRVVLSEKVLHYGVLADVIVPPESWRIFRHEHALHALSRACRDEVVVDVRQTVGLLVPALKAYGSHFGKAVRDALSQCFRRCVDALHAQAVHVDRGT